MSSTHSEDSDGVLGESGYEILTDSTLMTDDEDDGASSVASIDENDNVSSLADSTDSLALLPADSEHHDPHPIPSFGGLDEQHLDESGMTLREAQSFSDEVVFDEPEDIVGDQVTVCHKLTAFSDNETAEICRHLRLADGQVTSLFATVRQTMSKELLQMDEPFRLLYVGSTAAKDDIQQKLAAALAVTISESTSSCGSWEGIKSPKFNIIPISSFGSKSLSPEVELVESSGLDMIFDVCTAAKATKQEGRQDVLSLWLNGNQNVSSVCGDGGVRLESPGWKLPHLAVVYCSDDDNSQRRMTRVFARAFMARHAIPTLVLSQNPLYHKSIESPALDIRSVHVCIEAESQEAGHQILRRIPIDLSTFVSLSPRQLNRNLGFLTGLNRSEAPATPGGRTRAATANTMNDVEKEPRGSDASNSLYWLRDRKRDGLWKLMLVGWLFVAGLAGATIGIAYLKVVKTSDHTSRAVSPVEAIITSSFSSSSTTSAMLSAEPIPSEASISNIASSLATAVYSKNQLTEPRIPILNSSDQFELKTTDYSHIVIRPPQKYLSLRKPPPLFVRVTRRHDTIDAELSKNSDGAYTLSLEDAEAWGSLNVSIWTKSKPIVRQCREVDLGAPWMQVSRWTKAVAERKTDLQTFIDQTAGEAKELATGLTQTAGQRAAEIKTVVLSRAREYSKEVSSSLSKVYQGSQGLSFKLRSPQNAEYVRKAQSRAKSIWKHHKEACSIFRKSRCG
jgi:hypothetical protein